MEIKVAKNAGYCFGVKRAIEMVEETLKKYEGNRVYSLGEIIHNPQVVERLKRRGLIVVRDIEDVEENSTVIISAHGRSEEDIARLKKKGCKIVNATCPYVRLPQSIIKKMSSEGYLVILLGDREHPEVKGLVSFAKGENIRVVNTNEDFGGLETNKVAVLAQTTQNREDFNKLVNSLLGRFTEIRVFDTICDATKIRQEEAIKLAQEVDLMIVIGGRNSANTKRLYELSTRYCKRVLHIETEKEIDRSIIADAERIGITAGASTPDDIIKAVVERIRG
jgi:4-hydroxy-3-methylbut-2-enyl diphosphate reductase